jgi:hypothetical protein
VCYSVITDLSEVGDVYSCVHTMLNDCPEWATKDVRGREPGLRASSCEARIEAGRTTGLAIGSLQGIAEWWRGKWEYDL